MDVDMPVEHGFARMLSQQFILGHIVTVYIIPLRFETDMIQIQHSILNVFVGEHSR